MIYDKASLVQIPSGYKSGTLYSVVPNTSAGDFTVTGDPQGEATRVNKYGFIESVAADVPRLNYDPSNPQDPHLLLEPERTNFNTNSENFSSSYSTVGSPVSVENNLTSPNGGINAAKQTIATTGNGYYKFPTTVTENTHYTVSAFFKYISGSGEVVRFGAAGGVFGGDQENRINIKTGVVEFTNTGNTVVVEEYPNEWYRVSCTKDANADGTGGFLMFTNADDMVFGWWGVQFEAGSYATSYIPTTIAVTRTVDNVHLLNQTFITNYPFTVYANAKIDAVGNAIFSLNNTSASSYYLVFSLLSSSQVAVFRRNPSASSSDFWNFSYTVGDTIKVAVAFISATAYKLYINGTEIVDRTNGTSIPFNHDDISLGQFTITGDTGTRNSVNEFMLFNEALTDAELITLTT